jgi:hypothetical protein
MMFTLLLLFSLMLSLFSSSLPVHLYQSLHNAIYINEVCTSLKILSQMTEGLIKLIKSIVHVFEHKMSSSAQLSQHFPLVHYLLHYTFCLFTMHQFINNSHIVSFPRVIPIIVTSSMAMFLGGKKFFLNIALLT